MDKKYLLENLAIDDLTEDKKILLDIIGKEKFLELCLAFGGSYISFPLENTLHTAIAKRMIRESKELVQSGTITVPQLAIKYNVSYSFAYKILRRS